MQKETEDVAGEVGLQLVLCKLSAPCPWLWPTGAGVVRLGDAVGLHAGN